MTQEPGQLGTKRDCRFGMATIAPPRVRTITAYHQRTKHRADGYLCEVDVAARYVAIVTKSGALIHEATFHRSLEAIARAGIKANLVSGSMPWGKSSEGF